MNTKTSPNPWPIAIIVYFILFASFIAAFITFAVRQKMDLVSQDYYDAEMRFQKQIERISRTQPGLVHTSVDYNAARQTISLQLPPAQAKFQPYGKIQLYRPSDCSLDREIRFTPDAKGSQILDAAQLAAGYWKVRLHWTADGKEYFFDQPLTIVKN